MKKYLALRNNPDESTMFAELITFSQPYQLEFNNWNIKSSKPQNFNDFFATLTPLQSDLDHCSGLNIEQHQEFQQLISDFYYLSITMSHKAYSALKTLLPLNLSPRKYTLYFEQTASYMIVPPSLLSVDDERTKENYQYARESIPSDWHYFKYSPHDDFLLVSQTFYQCVQENNLTGGIFS